MSRDWRLFLDDILSPGINWDAIATKVPELDAALRASGKPEIP
jgi:hypothetical protein